MAVEALKSAGIAAYQGSSPQPTVKTAEPAAKSVKTVEKAVETTVRQPENKPAEARTSNRTQEAPAVSKAAKTAEPVLSDGKEAAEGKTPTEALKRAVEEINKQVVNSEAVFGVHDSTNRVTIKIVDKKTKEVLKEYPPEKTLDMIAKVWELAGLLVDEKR